MRKHRRRIKRKPRNKKFKSKKTRSWLKKHLNAPISNQFTRMTTYLLILLETTFVIWWLQDLLLNWTELITKIKQVFGV